jgi:hypothetical protein
VEGGCFALVNIEHFLFYYFKVLESSIFFLVVLWVFKKHCAKVSERGKGGICLSSCEL